MRKINKRKKIFKPEPQPVAENPTSWTAIFKNYPRIIGMFILLLFLPPIGWLFTYKYSPYDKKTSLLIATVCTLFFVYAVFISPEHSFIDTAKLSRADFCTRYSEQAKKLAPRLGLAIDEEKIIVDGENFTYKFTDNIELAATTENNFVKEVKVTAAPTNTDESFQALNCFALIAATLSPELDQDKRGEIFRELQMLDKAATDDLNTSTTKGRITYSIKSNAGKFIFTAQINDDF